MAVRTHAEVAAAMGLSVSRVQQLEAKALRKLRIWADRWRWVSVTDEPFVRCLGSHVVPDCDEEATGPDGRCRDCGLDELLQDWQPDWDFIHRLEERISVTGECMDCREMPEVCACHRRSDS